jgi:hypothetical protein
MAVGFHSDNLFEQHARRSNMPILDAATIGASLLDVQAIIDGELPAVDWLVDGLIAKGDWPAAGLIDTNLH